VGKQVADLLLACWDERKSQRVQLVQLRSLLRASHATFLTQRKLAKRLSESLAGSHPDHEFSGGFERNFSELHPHFTPEQKELHKIIRGITEHSMRPLNMAMTEWLRKDTTFKATRRGHGPSAELAESLEDLEVHVLLWLSKYEAWIPGQERYALVYLEDEQLHGVGFPSAIDQLVERLVKGVRGGTEPTHALEPAAGPVPNGESSPPAQ